ncbi:MAG: T9SS type A sorting domain-containing protein [Chitinophagaceae bacterium]
MEKFNLLPDPAAAVFRRITAALFFILFLSFSSYAQTTNISGVVNTYHKVIEVLPSKACVRVADITGLDVNSRVMIVQMKGATITTTNTAAFGDTLSLNQAGNYEIGTVCFIIGDSVFLFHNLFNSYGVPGKVQLVQFAEYYSATVADTVKAAPWDSAAGTGGVIAIYADQDITLNAPIYADSSGNRGGAYFKHNSNCGFFSPVGTGYAYDANVLGSELNGAYKGEGVANIPSTLDGGKGAPANGGGGGNNHKNSGAGGANLTTGGNGGGNSSNAPIGCNTSGNYGRAGKALSSWGGTKIFLGGGAGAGHAKDGSSSFCYGGNGGGIIFLWANELIGNSYSISANGGRGGDGPGEGVGGGGAGGTLVLHISTYTGAVNISSNGGNGGDSFNDFSNNRCFGGGGGGSGGVLYFTGSIPGLATITRNAGAGGLEFNRGTCGAPVPGAPGSLGTLTPSYTFSRSTDPAGYCSFLLPVKLVIFNAVLVDKKVVLSWEIDNPADITRFIIERSVNGHQWMELKTIAADDQTRNYTSTDANPVPGRTFYRIKFIEKNNTLSYSSIRKITTGKADEFIVYPNPASSKIMVAGNYHYPAALKLLDVSGKIIFRGTILTSPAEINLPSLPAGIYILTVNQSVQKLIIR